MKKGQFPRTSIPPAFDGLWVWLDESDRNG
jgi:hypothetical protein